MVPVMSAVRRMTSQSRHDERDLGIAQGRRLAITATALAQANWGR